MTTAKKPMTTKQAADILVEFNAWRRGREVAAICPHPSDVGLAIDLAVQFMRKKPRNKTPDCPKCGIMRSRHA
jgi:hypothetical protein